MLHELIFSGQHQFQKFNVCVCFIFVCTIFVMAHLQRALVIFFPPPTTTSATCSLRALSIVIFLPIGAIACATCPSKAKGRLLACFLLSLLYAYCFGIAFHLDVDSVISTDHTGTGSDLRSLPKGTLFSTDRRQHLVKV